METTVLFKRNINDTKQMQELIVKLNLDLILYIKIKLLKL